MISSDSHIYRPYLEVECVCEGSLGTELRTAPGSPMLVAVACGHAVGHGSVAGPELVHAVFVGFWGAGGPC